MTSWHCGENKQMMTVTAHWWARRELMQTVVWLQVLSTHTGLHHISNSDTEYLCLSLFKFISLAFVLQSLHAISGLWIWSTLGKMRLKHDLEMSCDCENERFSVVSRLHISTREQQLIKTDPSSNISGLMCPHKLFFFSIMKWSKQSRNPESAAAAQQCLFQQKYYHSVRMPKFQLMQIAS